MESRRNGGRKSKSADYLSQFVSSNGLKALLSIRKSASELSPLSLYTPTETLMRKDKRKRVRGRKGMAEAIRKTLVTTKN